LPFEPRVAFLSWASKRVPRPRGTEARNWSRELTVEGARNPPHDRDRLAGRARHPARPAGSPGQRGVALADRPALAPGRAPGPGGPLRPRGLDLRRRRGRGDPPG